jgi:ribonuclease HI
MEITAALEALRYWTTQPISEIEVVSDSTYVVNCFKDRWYAGWLRRGWKNSQGQPVANRDIWEELFALTIDGDRTVTFSWVKGHSGDTMNDWVDALATAAADSQRGRVGRVGPTG